MAAARIPALPPVTSVEMLVERLRNAITNSSGETFYPDGMRLNLSEAHLQWDASLRYHNLFGQVPKKICNCGAASRSVQQAVNVFERAPFDQVVFYCNSPNVKMLYAINSAEMQNEMSKMEGFYKVDITYTNTENLAALSHMVASPFLPTLPSFTTLPTLPTSTNRSVFETDQTAPSLAALSHMVASPLLPTLPSLTTVTESARSVEPFGKTRLSFSKAPREVTLCADTSVLDFDGEPAAERVLMLWELHVQNSNGGNCYSPLYQWSQTEKKRLNLAASVRTKMNNSICNLAMVYVYLTSLSVEDLATEVQKKKLYSTLRDAARAYGQTVQQSADENTTYFKKAHLIAIQRQNMMVM